MRVSALQVHETERLYWGKECLKTPFYNCIFKPNLRLQVVHALDLTLNSYIRSLLHMSILYIMDCQNMLIIPITNKCFCLGNNGSNAGIHCALPGMCTILMSRYVLISCCAFPINSIKTKANHGTPTLLEGSTPQVVTQW